MTNYYYTNDLPNDVKLQGDIAVDTEAMGLNNLRDRLCVVQLSTGDGNAHIIHFPEAKYNCPNLKSVLMQESAQYLFHFARFDVAIIKHYLNVDFSNIYCTKIASRLARTYTDSHGLKDLCNELLSVKLSKQQQTSNWGADSLTPEQIKYAASDVLHLHDLRKALNIMLKKCGRDEVAAKVMNFLPTRAELDLMGWIDFDIFQH